MDESWFYFLEQLLNGLTVGSTYALIAIGYSLVYSIIGMINFAHGEIYMIGSYVSFVVLACLALMGVDSVALILIGAFVISIIITSVYGFAVERVAYHPLRNSNRLIALISAIGMSIFLQNYVRIAQGSRDIAMPGIISGGWTFGPPDDFNVTLSYMQVVIFFITIVTMALLTLFISRYSMGRACLSSFHGYRHAFVTRGFDA